MFKDLTEKIILFNFEKFPGFFSTFNYKFTSSVAQRAIVEYGVALFSKKVSHLAMLFPKFMCISWKFTYLDVFSV